MADPNPQAAAAVVYEERLRVIVHLPVGHEDEELAAYEVLDLLKKQKDDPSESVKVMGFTNLPARLPADSSSLYAKNLLALLPLLTDKDSKAFAPAWDDEIIQGAMLTRNGALVHPHFAPKSAA